MMGSNMHTNLHPELGAYSHTRTAVGELVFISGQVPVTPDGELAGRDPDSQARQVVENLVAALEGSGLTPADVVKLTTYVTEPEVAQALSAARAEHFPPPYPASTVAVVPALLSSDWMIEVEAIASKGDA